MEQVFLLFLKRRERRLLAEIETDILVKRPDVSQLIFDVPGCSPGTAERHDILDMHAPRAREEKHARG